MCVTNFTESEQWDTVIEGNDDLLEKYMSGKSLEALELEQRGKHKISELFSVPSLSWKCKK